MRLLQLAVGQGQVGSQSPLSCPHLARAPPACLPTGPEVVGQATRVLQTLVAKTDLEITLEEHDFGGIAIDNHGEPLPQSTLDACLSADAILMGATFPSPLPSCVLSETDAGYVHFPFFAGSVGGPKWGVGPVRPEQGLLKLRKELGLYANIRPANFASDSLLKHSPLKEHIAKGFDMVVVREVRFLA